MNVSRPEWDRFRDAERRGALNYIDVAKILAATKLVVRGEVIPLNMPLDSPKLLGGRPPLKRWARLHNSLRHLGKRRYIVVNDDVVEFALHGSSHIDAFAHFGLIEPGVDGVFYGGAGLDETQPDPLAKTVGIDSLGGAIVTRGVLIDTVASLVGTAAGHLPDGFRVNADSIKEALRRQGVALEPGDAVLIYTGYEDRLNQSGGQPPTQVAGIDGTTLPLWRDACIALLAADNVAVEMSPADLSIHIGALRNLGIPLGELWSLERLAAACRADGVYEFLLVSVPLNLAGAFGSPANAVAIR